MDLDVYRRRMSSEEINALPLVHYEGPITLIRTTGELAKAIEDIGQDPVLGFDTETRPTFRKGRVNPPALSQLATAGHVYLIQLSWLPLGQALPSVFANPHQIKAGVGIGEDMRELAKLYPFTPAGHVDLGRIAYQHKIWSRGLRPLTANFFRQRIPKGSQCSNWSLRELSEKQMVYAATDAWIGRRLFMKMRDLGLVDTLAQEP